MAYYLKNSNIKGAGTGLFTKHPIKKGDFMHVDFTRNEHRPINLFEYDFNQSKETRMLNHSVNPNSTCRFDNKNKLVRYASRDIKAGEEITADYRQILKTVKDQGHRFFINILWFDGEKVNDISNLL